MRVIHILAGAGGKYDCPNCRRDRALIGALKSHDVKMVPVSLYLPLLLDPAELEVNAPVFFGAINIYLQEKSGFFRKTPRFLDALWDLNPLLKLAGEMGQSTEAKGLEELTISMLQGEEGRQKKEVKRLVDWLKTEGKPDVVHLSNALLLGLAKPIATRLKIPVICSLQDEDSWINSMRTEYWQRTWQTMAEQAKYVTTFVPVSDYFSNLMQEKLSLSSSQLKTVPIGLDLHLYKRNAIDLTSPTLGYLSPFRARGGLAKLIITLKDLIKEHPNINLEAASWGGEDEPQYLRYIKELISKYQLEDRVKLLPKQTRQEQIEFFQRITLFSNPTSVPEAFGIYLIEAMASGVPIIQQNTGGYPEILSKGGGILLNDEKQETLTECISNLLKNEDKLKSLSNDAYNSAQQFFTANEMAQQIMEIYKGAKGSSFSCI